MDYAKLDGADFQFGMQIVEITEEGPVFPKNIPDENGMTTRPGVFAAGDVVTGAKTVVHAVAAAKQTAEAIDVFMRP